MALFGGNKESKEEKKLAREQEILKKYNLQSISDPDDIASVRKIVTELAGTNLKEAGAIITGKEKDMLEIQMCYQRTILEQNFIIIRQLDRIAKSLEK